MALQAQFEVAPHVPPLAGEDAVHHAVAHRAVAAERVMAQHAIPPGAERFDRALRSEVEAGAPRR